MGRPQKVKADLQTVMAVEPVTVVPEPVNADIASINEQIRQQLDKKVQVLSPFNPISQIDRINAISEINRRINILEAQKTLKAV